MNKSVIYPESGAQRFLIKREQINHIRKLKGIGSIIKMHPHVLANIKLKNKKDQLAEERCTEIEKCNRLLLEKMMRINRKEHFKSKSIERSKHNSKMNNTLEDKVNSVI
jgi:Hemingway/CFA97